MSPTYVEPVAQERDNPSGTAARKTIWDCYRKAAEAGDPAPTMKELMTATGLYSSSTVHTHVKLLHERGVLRKKGARYSLARVASVAEVANG